MLRSHSSNGKKLKQRKTYFLTCYYFFFFKTGMFMHNMKQSKSILKTKENTKAWGYILNPWRENKGEKQRKRKTTRVQSYGKQTFVKKKKILIWLLNCMPRLIVATENCTPKHNRKKGSYWVCHLRYFSCNKFCEELNVQSHRKRWMDQWLCG